MDSEAAVTHIRWDIYKLDRWFNRYEVKTVIFGPGTPANGLSIHLGKTTTLRGALRIVRRDRRDKAAEITRKLVWHDHLEPEELEERDG